MELLLLVQSLGTMEAIASRGLSTKWNPAMDSAFVPSVKVLLKMPLILT